MQVNPNQNKAARGVVAAETLEHEATNNIGQKKRESGSEVPKHRRDHANTIEYGDKGRLTSGPSPSVPASTTSGARERVKGEIIRSRITK